MLSLYKIYNSNTNCLKDKNQYNDKKLNYGNNFR